MDIFNLLSYVNKISLLAFFVTTLVVGYQVYILKKEKTKEKVPSIPDFKAMEKPNEVINYSRLPSFLTKKNSKQVNNSKLVFLIISLLTVMVVISVFVLIKQNNSIKNEALDNLIVANIPSPTIKISTPTPKPIITLSPSTIQIIKPTLTLSPSPKITLTPSPTKIVKQNSILSKEAIGKEVLVSPTITVSPSPIISSAPSLSPSPTEILLAQAPTITPTVGSNNTSPTQEVAKSKPQTLPESGSIEKGLLIIGVAILAIFFSFWF